MTPRTAKATAIHTAVIGDRFDAADVPAADDNVCSLLIVSVLTKSSDEMRVDPVRIEPAGHEIAGAHPGSVHPLSEADAGPGCTARGGKHLHPLEGLPHAARAQRTGV